MSPELLRRGCEAAGLKYAEGHGWWHVTSNGMWAWYENDPALPHYVAGLLVERVQKEEQWHPYCNSMFAAIQPKLAYLNTGYDVELALKTLAEATPEQRITAALAVLEDKP